jgi:hypothetical protein
LRTILLLHVAAGGLSLVAGFAALSAVKGSRPHRATGRVFVYAMLTMGLTGAGIAAATGVETSVVMGVFAAYLVFTGFISIARFAHGHWWMSVVGSGIAFALAIALANLGRRALASPTGEIEGLPAPMAFIFAGVAALAGVSDLRLLRQRQHQGGGRVVRHLWRMCFALFIAAASFFLGQTDTIPRALRSPVLLAAPVLTPLLVMAFWAWRTRRREFTLPVTSRVRVDPN